jgi:hypothetical protein
LGDACYLTIGIIVQVKLRGIFGVTGGVEFDGVVTDLSDSVAAALVAVVG